MDTLKTAVVVVLLLAVLYGVYVVLNKPEQYSQDLVGWEAGAADPGLQIELGVPEAGISEADSAAPNTTAAPYGTATTESNSPAANPHANHFTAAPGTIQQDATAVPPPADSGLGERLSLPIPEPSTAAAPAIAAPDLLGGTESSPSYTNEISSLDSSGNSPASSELSSSGSSYAANATPTAPAFTSVGNQGASLESELADAQPGANRADESNRYSDSVPLRPSPALESGDSEFAVPSPATSEQANVNDISESGAPGSAASTFQSALESAHSKIEAEAWKDALIKLSPYYTDPSLSADEFSQLVDLLDPLAGKVIYSTEHLLEPAYQSQPGDTLANIADRYEVPWQLLANINGIENPETLLAGRALKVVRGPFRAEVSLNRKELTLFVGQLYAGRFTISVGSDPVPVPGQYQINDKQPGRTYYAGNGQTVSIDDPSNPYGGVWLDLGSNFCIHGSSPNGTSPGQGCIALSPRDAADIYGILSKGSSVLVR